MAAAGGAHRRAQSVDRYVRSRCKLLSAASFLWRFGLRFSSGSVPAACCTCLGAREAEDDARGRLLAAIAACVRGWCISTSYTEGDHLLPSPTLHLLPCQRLSPPGVELRARARRLTVEA